MTENTPPLPEQLWRWFTVPQQPLRPGDPPPRYGHPAWVAGAGFGGMAALFEFAFFMQGGSDARLADSLIGQAILAGPVLAAFVLGALVFAQSPRTGAHQPVASALNGMLIAALCYPVAGLCIYLSTVVALAEPFTVWGLFSIMFMVMFYGFLFTFIFTLPVGALAGVLLWYFSPWRRAQQP